MGQIYLIRHGQASFGSADYDRLSELGVQQARVLGEWCAERRQGFTRVITGGMNRHRQTAVACLGELPRHLRKEGDWETDAGFAEYDHEEILIRARPEFADAEVLNRFLTDSGQPRQTFQLLFEAAMARWSSGEHDADYSESWNTFRQRCVAALQRVLMTPGESQTVVIFTSGGTISALCQHVMGLPDAKVFEINWSLVNSGVTRLLFNADRLSMSYLNNFSHLEWRAQPGSITYR
ncbi:broad specificity phosphatase PhoE [Actimicrobium sp. GrIS 1.19]|uniref:histidine phosphatase family protein n=1 Tax=Actimicrobium sp. GrIS 1.19 TaxID=3071708 RepID=UPI002E096DC6|nr:broad specificity phosphatase PhoE [Actimicrobium sp. GrIS 1.19]